MRAYLPAAAAMLLVAAPTWVRGQITPLTRYTAVSGALTRGTRIDLSTADTGVAFAALLTARTLPNPNFLLGYSKDTPNYHASIELPIEFLWLRGVRIKAAERDRQAARLRFAFDSVSIALDVDTIYTRSLATMARARLSRHTAAAADSLLRIAIARRNAGDASDLDVELARVNAGQAASLAAADSLSLVGGLFDLQTALGIEGDRITVLPSDSLYVPEEDTLGPISGEPLAVAAARLTAEAAQFAATLQHRQRIGGPLVLFGFDAHDPGGQSGLLPQFGIAVPIPIFDRNSGAIALANAERRRAQAQLRQARVESQTRIARTSRERALAFARIRQDQQLVSSANRVASMSITAYREGASPLASVLEAQRTVREVLATYVEDLATAWIASAAFRVFTLTSEGLIR